MFQFSAFFVIAKLICIFLLGSISIPLLTRRAKKHFPSRIVSIVSYTAWSILTVLVLSGILESIGLTAVANITAVIVLGASLCFQSLATSIIDGAFIILEHKIVEGERYSIDGDEGVVTDRGIRTVTFVDADGQEFYVPNTTIYSSTVKRIKENAKE